MSLIKKMTIALLIVALLTVSIFILLVASSHHIRDQHVVWQEEKIIFLRLVFQEIERDSSPKAIRRIKRILNGEARFAYQGYNYATDPQMLNFDELQTKYQAGEVSYWHKTRQGAARVQFLLIDNTRYLLFKFNHGARLLVKLAANPFDWSFLAGLLLWLMVPFGFIWLTFYIYLRYKLVPVTTLNKNVSNFVNQNSSLPSQIKKDEIQSLIDGFANMRIRVNTLLEHQNRLLSHVSHELRSPLARMKLALEMIPDQAGKKELADDLGVLEQLTDQLLLQQAVQISHENFSQHELYSFIQEQIKLAQVTGAARYKNKQINFKLIATSKQINIKTNLELLAHAIANVLINAYCYAKTQVVVEIEHSSAHTIISISDDGFGISRSDQQKIFEPFFRSEANTQGNVAPGTGLGLSISKNAINSIGAEIRATDSQAGGLKIIITLPAQLNQSRKTDT